MIRHPPILWLLCVMLCVSSWTTRAHPLDPALLSVVAASDARFQVVWRTPRLQPRNAPIYPIFPEGCTETSEHEVSEVADWVTQRWQMECTAHSLAGQAIGIQGLRGRKTDAIVRVTLPDGRKLTGLLNPRQPNWVIPEKASRLSVFGQYLRLGLEHILTGTDHLLFIFGLLLLIRNLKSLFWTLTAFTLGHSLTLSLAALKLIHVPQAPVEALIAFSIFVVALEISRERSLGRPSVMMRLPQFMALFFGFLHGLGFAGALAEVGLPEDEIPAALFAFNVGIEVGQILFVGLVLALYAILKRYFGAMLRLGWLPEYVIGSLASMWLFERLWVLL